MAKRILFTTIYSADAVKIAINKISGIDEIFYIVEENLQKDTSKEAKIKLESIETLNKAYGDIIQIHALKVHDIYDISNIMLKVIEKIDSLLKEDEIFIHISEGRKTLALGLLFAAYVRKERIKDIYYVIKDENRLLSLPKLNFSINESKKKILKEINNGNEDKEKIRKELGLSSISIIYQYINELKAEGFITNGEHLKITELGKVMIL